VNDRSLVNVLAQAGFRGKALQTAFGIAKRESGGRAEAFNGNTGTGDRSYGLFQINMLGSMGPARRQQFGLRSDDDLFNPLTNAKSAFRMSNGGKDFGAWGIGPNAYRSGAGYDTIAKYVDETPAFAPAGRKTPDFKLPDFDVGKELARGAKAEPFKLPDFDVESFLDRGDSNLGFGLTAPPRQARASANAMDEFGLVPPPPIGVQKVVAEARARSYGGTTQAGPHRPAPTPKVNLAMQIARAQLGKPYVWGASTPGVGFDCSGLIEYAFEKAGIPTPGRLTTFSMRSVGRHVPSLTMAKPGDWLITNGGEHVVMYMGNGQVIAAPHTGEVVQMQPVSRFVGDIVDIRRYP
jgi:cell wall-associated NlpC family hydrolase